jgi:hypothetical protein
VATAPAKRSGASSFIRSVLKLTNRFRVANGLGKLRANRRLQAAALGHSRAMAEQDFYSHTGVDGSTPGERAEGSGYVWQAVGAAAPVLAVDQELIAVGVALEGAAADAQVQSRLASGQPFGVGWGHRMWRAGGSRRVWIVVTGAGVVGLQRAVARGLVPVAA